MRKKFNIITIIFIALLAAALLTGCFGSKSITDMGEQQEIVWEGEPLDVEYFSFSLSGMSMEANYTYTAEKAENGQTHIFLSLYAGNRESELDVDLPVMEKLGEIAGKYHMDKWDGFDEADPTILDGSMFSFEMTLSDGTKISAHGSNSFPDGFREASSEIYELFDPIVREYSDIYPKTLESDDIDTFMISLRSPDSAFTDFYFRISKYENEDDEIDYNINGYEPFDPEFVENFFGYSDAFPYEELQKIVRKYDIPKWNGWDKSAENYDECKWFQLDIYYESGESISAMGTLYPESYENAEAEIVQLIKDFIENNRDSFKEWEG